MNPSAFLHRGLDRINQILSKRRGQITLASGVGRWITFISSLPEVKNILDVGTWSGAGSTTCVAKGVLSRNRDQDTEVSVIGLEVNKQMAEMATRRLRKYPFVRILYGTIADSDQFDSGNLTAEESVWFNQDLEHNSLASNVIRQIPEVLHLVIFDGGEFSTLAEFETLRSRLVAWVVLDDINTRKNRVVMEILEADKSFELIAKSKERNGTAVFLKVS
jgi:hypothetical protein